uniref:DDE Tnp4 domain-containing protein n=2 Tax=Oncorhynchus tshawytscha TaxID=74940 RepID=A0AAZ3P7Q3_ONCTS
MTHLSLGLKQKDLAHWFSIHQSTVSRIIISWANFLYCLLGSARIWIPRETVKAHLPPEFKDYPDTQIVIDCTELRCQTPSSLLLQSEVFSSYKSHCTFKGMLGTSPHGAVTFMSSLCAGSVSDKISKQSGMISLLSPDMAIMVDKGFLVDDIVPCKVYRPAFLSRCTQMPAHEVRETQSIARLRVHVERMICRVKEHKLFDTVIPLTISGSINQLFAFWSTIKMDLWSEHGPSQCKCTCVYLVVAK